MLLETCIGDTGTARKASQALYSATLVRMDEVRTTSAWILDPMGKLPSPTLGVRRVLDWDSSTQKVLGLAERRLGPDIIHGFKPPWAI